MKEQNAAIIIRRHKKGAVFETFELTPPNKIVTKTQGRIKRCFPSAAVFVNSTTLAAPDFRSAVASTIAKMSYQGVPEMTQILTKPGQKPIGDTTSPALVTDLFFSFLSANGKPAAVRRFWKNTREEATLSESKSSPWRRSAVWLLVRVVLHLKMSTTDRGAMADGLYKRSMVFYMSRLLKHAMVAQLPSDILYVMNAKLARRMVKLSLSHEKWMPSVQKPMSMATELLESRWE